MSRESDFISNARRYARALWEAYHALLNMQDQWNALDYGSTLEDGAGENAGLTKAEVGAVVFDTTNEVKLRILDTGHKTNLARLL